MPLAVGVVLANCCIETTELEMKNRLCDRQHFISIGISLLAVMTSADFASAQVMSKQLLKRPTISPYLNLFRDDTVGLPAYHQFLRPQLELRDHLERESARMSQIQKEVHSNQTMILRQHSDPRAKSSGLSLRQTPGAYRRREAATFMNPLHFYQFPKAVRKSR